MVVLFALLCIGGCANNETNSNEETPNKDIGKISFTGRYYIDNNVLYSEDNTGKIRYYPMHILFRLWAVMCMLWHTQTIPILYIKLLITILLTELEIGLKIVE